MSYLPNLDRTRLATVGVFIAKLGRALRPQACDSRSDDELVRDVWDTVERVEKEGERRASERLEKARENAARGPTL